MPKCQLVLKTSKCLAAAFGVSNFTQVFITFFVLPSQFESSILNKTTSETAWGTQLFSFMWSISKLYMELIYLLLVS
jgi:hypothetical protein